MKRVLLSVCLLFVFIGSSSADAISGRVVSTDGTPLAGVEISIGGGMPAVYSGSDGSYSIRDLPAGTYQLVAAMSGAEAASLSVDLTGDGGTGECSFVLDFEGTAGAWQAERDLPRYPAAAALALKTDIVAGRDGMHHRGGRTGDLGFLVDGIPAVSPVTRNLDVCIPSGALADMAVESQPDAADGSCRSGAVLLCSRSAAPDWSGSAGISAGAVSVPGDEPSWHPNVPFRETRTYMGDYLDGTLTLGGPEPLTSAILPGTTRLLVSGEMLTGGHDHSDGWEVSDQGHWDNNTCDVRSGMGKLSWFPDALTEVEFGANLHHRERGWTDWAWMRFETAYVDPESGDTLAPAGDLDYALPTRFDSGTLLSTRLLRRIGQAASVELALFMDGSHVWNRIRQEGGGWIGEGFTEDDWMDYVPPAGMIDQDGFVRAGVSPGLWFDQRSTSSGMQLRGSWPIGTHVLQTGVEGTYTEARETSVMSQMSAPLIVFQHWAAHPGTGGAYLQDRMPFAGGLTAVAGARVDWFDPSFERETAQGLLGSHPDTKYWLSPRISLVQQISPSDAARVSYGHYSRMPGLVYLYYSADSVPDVSHKIAGNPDLGPERTISWEVGYSHVFGPAASFGLTGFYRDMEDLVTTIPRLTEAPGVTRQFVNGSSGHSQGIEISITGRPASYLFCSADFTLSWTHGQYSRPTENAEYSWDGSIIPTDETVYEFDRRRSLNVTLGGQVPGTVPCVGGLGISTLTTLRCGLPYDNAYHGVYALERNESRYPMRTTTDVHLWKGIEVLGAGVTGYLDIFNVFNRKNVDWIVDVAWYEAEMGDGSGRDLDPKGPMHNGHAYAPPRHFLLGVEVEW